MLLSCIAIKGFNIDSISPSIGCINYWHLVISAKKAMNVEGHMVMCVLHLRDDTRSSYIILGVLLLNIRETYITCTPEVLLQTNTQ